MSRFHRYGMLGVASLIAVAMIIGAGCSDKSSDDAGSGLAGTWRLTSVTEGGQTFNPAQMGLNITAVLRADGTATLTVQGFGETETEQGTWSAAGNTLTLTAGGEREQFRYNLQGNTLTLTEEGGATLVFQR